VGQRLLDRLDYIRVKPRCVVDIGAGTGTLSGKLLTCYPRSHLVSLDLAPAMLAHASLRRPLLQRLFPRQSFVCGDAETLPLADSCSDLILSNLMLQWCNDTDRVFREFRRILRPGGLLMFTSFGPDTLQELRSSWQTANGYTHVNAFLDMHDIGDALLREGFTAPVMDREAITLTYNEVRELMKDLKALGAHNVTAGRARGLTGKGALNKMLEAYEHYRSQGRLPASYEIIYGHCWAPTIADHRSEPGTVRIPLSRLQGGKHHR